LKIRGGNLGKNLYGLFKMLIVRLHGTEN
jgi:hypothetical protein